MGVNMHWNWLSSLRQCGLTPNMARMLSGSGSECARPVELPAEESELGPPEPDEGDEKEVKCLRARRREV